MRYIDRSECKKMTDRGNNSEVKAIGGLTRTATKIAEENKLGLLRTHWGKYRIIKESGLGSKYMRTFETLEEVNDFLTNLNK